MTSATIHRLGRKSAASTMARSSAGNATIRSVKRISAAPMKPRKNPAVMPTSAPIATADAVGDDADDERGARAVEEAREEVAAQEIGAERGTARSAAAARPRASARRKAARRDRRAQPAALRSQALRSPRSPRARSAQAAGALAAFQPPTPRAASWRRPSCCRVTVRGTSRGGRAPAAPLGSLVPAENQSDTCETRR